LLTIVLAEVEQLDARAVGFFGSPRDAGRYLNGLGKAVERNRKPSDVITFQAGGCRDEETVFADIEELASLGLVLVKGNEDGTFRRDARIKAAFDVCTTSWGLLC
jgi:hypothetical protein